MNSNVNNKYLVYPHLIPYFKTLDTSSEIANFFYNKLVIKSFMGFTLTFYIDSDASNSANSFDEFEEMWLKIGRGVEMEGLPKR